MDCSTPPWSGSTCGCCCPGRRPGVAPPPPPPCRWGRCAPPAVGDIWVRYLISLPASAFAAAALWFQGRRFAGSGYRRIARDCRWMGAAFAANGVVAGLIVPPARFGLAAILNYDWFLSIVGIPPQVFRAALAGILPVFRVR